MCAQATERPKSPRHRRWLMLGVGLPLCVLAYFATISVLPWYSTRQVIAGSPHLWALPQELQDKRVATTAGDRVEEPGYSMMIPGMRSAASAPLKPGTSIIRFASGASIVVLDPSGQVDTTKMLQSSTPKQAQVLREVFDPETLRSNYDLFAAAMATMPAQSTWWAGRARGTRTLLLLLNKKNAMSELPNIYTIQQNHLRGFQFGDPAVAPYRVNLDLFDAANRHYTFMLQPKDGHEAALTQPEINEMIASITPR